MKKVLIIVGSLRKESFNRQLSEVIVRELEGKAEVSYLDFSDIPFMNQDLEADVPAEIRRVREEVMAADGIWIVTPEYNYSYPGLLKNLLDWLSRPLKAGDFSSGTAIAGKKVALSAVAGRAAGSGSLAKLTELLGRIKCELLPSPVGVSLTPDAFRTGKLTLSDETLSAVTSEAQAFLSFIG